MKKLLLISVCLALTTWLVVAPGQAAFPGQNGRIAFESDRDGNAEIYAMNADGSAPTRLTNNTALDFTPAWSADGTKIAFESTRDGNTEIYVMNADGSGQTRRTNNAASDGDPSWSPDGTKIAFQSNRDGNFEIYAMNADGSGQTRLTNNAASDGFPTWSPDGTKIAFQSHRDAGGNGEIYAMNADGSAQTRLTTDVAIEAHPHWSPDGTKIAFESNRDGNFEVYVMNADGSGQTNRTNSPTVDDLPTWSPDGTKIAFRSDRDGNTEIYAMNAGGSGQTRLTNNSASDSRPDWGPLAGVAYPTPTPTPTPEQCRDGIDNDGDGAVDQQDAGCLSGPSDSFNPFDRNEGDENLRQLALCGRRSISLVRADLRGRRVLLSGLVASRFANQTVTIDATGVGASRVLARVRASADGEFKARVKRPRKRFLKKARYQAIVGSARSVKLKLPQSLESTSIRRSGGSIVIRGKVKRELLGKRNPVVIRRLTCGRYTQVGQARPNRRGIYTVRFAAPAVAAAALYRAETKVLSRPGGRRYVRQFARAVSIIVGTGTG